MACRNQLTVNIKLPRVAQSPANTCSECHLPACLCRLSIQYRYVRARGFLRMLLAFPSCLLVVTSLRRPRFVSLFPSAEKNKKQQDYNHGSFLDELGVCLAVEPGMAEFSIFAVIHTVCSVVSHSKFQYDQLSCLCSLI